MCCWLTRTGTAASTSSRTGVTSDGPRGSGAFPGRWPAWPVPGGGVRRAASCRGPARDRCDGPAHRQLPRGLADGGGAVSAELERLTAASDAARAIIAGLPPHDGGLLLRVAVTDTMTNERLATGFISYELPKPQ